jgi:hypothetical protein
MIKEAHVGIQDGEVVLRVMERMDGGDIPLKVT